MNGLEAIKERILADARESAEDIRNRTEQQIDKMVADGETRAAVIISEASEKAVKNAQAIHMRAQSMAALEKRKSILQARRKLVDQVIEKAVVKLCSLPDDDKIELYVKMLKSVDDGNSIGEVEFSAQDEKLSREILNHFSDRLQKSEHQGRFSGGIVLRRGQIEENLSLEMIVRKNRSELVRTAARQLFHAMQADDGVTAN